MSSLLSTASVWEPTDNTILKKKTPTMNANIRKTIKNRARSLGEPDEYSTDENPLVMGSGNSNSPMSISELQAHNAQKQSRVNEMINHMTNVNIQNDGNKLADFTPISYPTNTIRKPDINHSGQYSGKPNTSQPLLPKNQSSSPSLRGELYAPNETSLGKYSNYRSAHDPSNLLKSNSSGVAPYYSKMGIGKNDTDDRLMEKINYMVRLLEEQQLEKTNNITEEFILYTLLGVFVIYVVDSFSRSGKYMR
jgi:hypothetical protein